MLRWSETVLGVLYSFEKKSYWLIMLKYSTGIYPNPATQALSESQGAEIEHQDNCRKAELCTSLLSWNLNLNMSRTFLGLLEIRTVCSMNGSHISFLVILPKKVPCFAKAVLSPSEKLVAHQQWVWYIYCAAAWKSELGPASQRQGIEMGGY